MASAYRGRFAPSPTGPLHLGSLLVALASWLQARSQNGEWILRIEDLDRSRGHARFSDDILHTLDRFGLHWDGPVLYQSQRDAAYQAALEQMDERNLLYACRCTRRELQESQAGVDGPVYPGTCLRAAPSLSEKHALRLKVNDARIQFCDRIQGECRQALAQDVGDFILRRSDGLFAYQLAVVVDDADQGITEILRGADLLNSTPRQIYLQALLGLDTPVYAHVPLLLAHCRQQAQQTNQSDPVREPRHRKAPCAAASSCSVIHHRQTLAPVTCSTGPTALVAHPDSTGSYAGGYGIISPSWFSLTFSLEHSCQTPLSS